ncbi:MAG: hypothetical protein NTX61_03235 [Bacteroidetes bacterium]|nr:hypothetical protein [Bacteroidota bacterium]
MFARITLNRPSWKLGIDPLWKLNITDQEYEELKTFLNTNIIENTSTLYWNQEAALFFSEWWKREYNGGAHNKRDVVLSLQLPDYEEELYSAAKEGAKRLRIVYIRIKNTRRLDTLFMQGGLPLNALITAEGVNNRYRNYLNTIIRYICSHHLNWESVDFIEKFNPYIAQSYHNTVMYSLTLQIARAIYYEDNTLFPFNMEDEGFELLVKELRETKKESPKVIREVPFHTKWFIEKADNQLSLIYEIEYETIISRNWVQTNLGNPEDPYRTIDIIIHDRLTQRFVRKNNGDYITKINDLQIIGQIDNYIGSTITILLSTNTNKIFNINIPGSDIPDLNEPTLVTHVKTDKNVSRWLIVNNPVPANLNAIICSPNWSSSSQFEIITFKNETLRWFTFNQAINITSGQEELSFDTNYLIEYNIDFGIPRLEWLQKSNYLTVTKNPEIKAYDFDDKRVSANQVSINYRLKGDIDWVKYNINQVLPIGLIEFNVRINNQIPVRKKIYNTGPMNYNILNSDTNTGIVEWSWNQGEVIPINMNDGLTIESANHPNRWKISVNQDVLQYSNLIQFEFRSRQDTSTRLILSVATPFWGVVLKDPRGNVVSSDICVSKNALLGYRCSVMGVDQIPIKIQYFKLSVDEQPCAEEVTRFYKGIDNSLQMLASPLETIFKLHRHSIFEFFDKGYCRITFGNFLSIKVDIFNANTEKENGHIYTIDSEGNKIDDFQYDVFAVPVDCSPQQVKVFNLQKNNDGGYSIITEPDALKQFIVFSKISSMDYIHLRPRYHNLDNALNAGDFPEGTIKELHNEQIVRTKEVLLDNDFNHDSWVLVGKYFEIVSEFNLPFQTFNCFSAISREKKLMTRMAILMLSCSTSNQFKLYNDLSKFESEFANAWHWIGIDYWLAAIDSYLVSFNVESETTQGLIIAEMINKVTELLSLKAIDLVEKGKLKVFFKKIFAMQRFPGYNGQPSPGEIQDERIKFNNGNGLFIPNYVSNRYPVIPLQFQKYFIVDRNILDLWGGLMLSPLFSALAFTGKKEIFNEQNSKYINKQRVLYYIDLDSEWYFDVYQKMIKRII